MFDLIIMNPPFSNRRSGGPDTSVNFYWRFVSKAMELKPKHLVFISPSCWESALNKPTRQGVYECLETAAQFGPHPPAAVTHWQPGAFRVIGGRDSRKPIMPAFDVEVIANPLSVGRHITPYHGVGNTWKRIYPGDECPWCTPLMDGPDAAAACDWIISNCATIADWWGRPANGMAYFRRAMLRGLLA